MDDEELASLLDYFLDTSQEREMGLLHHSHLPPFQQLVPICCLRQFLNCDDFLGDEILCEIVRTEPCLFELLKYFVFLHAIKSINRVDQVFAQKLGWIKVQLLNCFKILFSFFGFTFSIGFSTFSLKIY